MPWLKVCGQLASPKVLTVHSSFPVAVGSYLVLVELDMVVLLYSA